MSVTLAQLEVAIRDRHPAFDRYQLPLASIGRHLSDFQRELAEEIFKLDGELVTEVQTFTVDAAVLASGKALNPHYAVAAGTVTKAAIDYPLRFLTYRHQHVPVHFPSAYVRAGTFRVLGPVADWPTDGSVSVEIILNQVPVDLISPSSVLVLPDSARPVMVAEGIAFAAEKLLGEAAPPFRKDADGERIKYLSAVQAGARPR